MRCSRATPGIDSARGAPALHPRTDAVMIIMTDKAVRAPAAHTRVPAGAGPRDLRPTRRAHRPRRDARADGKARAQGGDGARPRGDHATCCRPAYSAVGLSNEQCICVFGVAEGEIAPCKETGEEITARWYSPGRAPGDAETRDLRLLGPGLQLHVDHRL